MLEMNRIFDDIPKVGLDVGIFVGAADGAVDGMEVGEQRPKLLAVRQSAIGHIDALYVRHLCFAISVTVPWLPNTEFPGEEPKQEA